MKNKEKKDYEISRNIDELLGGVIAQTDDTICFAKKKLEHDLSAIGAKVADANDLSQEIKELSKKQEKILETVQEKTSVIYENLGDIELCNKK